MGNDGGSIPDRRDLVRTKVKAEQADKANQTRARWHFCALSKRPLEEPVVSCALGKLYNKDAILEYLLDKKAYGDGEEICGHIKSLKDIKLLTLTPNPTPSSASPTATNMSTDRTQFVCPLTLKEMNGAQPFVYLSTCGCVISQAGLKALTRNAASGSTPPADEQNGEGQPALEICPQCSKKYSKDDIILLNPNKEKEDEMRVIMETKKLSAKSSKAKKRKAASKEIEDSENSTAADSTNKVKRPKLNTTRSTANAPTVNPSIAATSRAVAQSLAQEEAKRKTNMSEAVRSLYESKNKDKKETFMTRGTFTRYA